MTLNDAMRSLEEARNSLRDAKHSMTALSASGAVADELRQATTELMDGVHEVEAALAQQFSDDREAVDA